MVERAAAGEAPSSAQPPQAEARRARLTASSPPESIGTEGQCRRAGAVPACQWGDRTACADFEHMANLPLTAWRGLTAGFRAFDLLLTDMREDGAEVFILDDRRLRNLPRLVKGGVRQVEPTVADRQPAVGIIDDGDALAAEPARDRVRLKQEHDLVVLQGQVVGDRPLFAPNEDVGKVVAG
jgi:hypothetical protein